MDDHGKLAKVTTDQSRLSPVVAQILAHEPTPEVLEKILSVQAVWEANEARKAYAAALVGLKRDLPAHIKHDKRVDYGQTHYTHTSLAAVMDAVQEHLTQHGFALTWEPSTEGGLVRVTCRLTHEAGHSETCTIESKPDSSGQKGPAQQIASTITYLSRYTALSLLGIATGDMDEPHGPQDPDRVDAARNLKACAKLRAKGIPVEDAEAYLAKPRDHWTAADLADLTTWVKERAE